MRRPNPDPPIRRRLLDVAQRLITAQGFAATSVDAICDAARVSKGNFFYYFGNKEALAKALLERHASSICKTIEEGTFRKAKAKDPLARILGYLDTFIEASRHLRGTTGCLFATFASESADLERGLRALCADGFTRWAEGLKRDLDETSARHRARGGVDTRGLAHHIVAVLEGSLLVARAKDDPSVYASSIHHLKRYVEGVFRPVPGFNAESPTLAGRRRTVRSRGGR